MASRSDIPKRNVTEGENTSEPEKLYVNKCQMSRKFLDIYREIEKKANSTLTPEELQGLGIKFNRWNTKTTKRKPVFFQQFPPDDFLSYKVPEFDLHYLIDIREYCYAVQLQLGECFSGAEHISTRETLLDSTGWNVENFDKPSVFEFGKRDDPINRYQWSAYGMLGREDLPHTIVASKHLSGESRFILRSELMILLLTMCGKGLKEELLRHEVTPVLLLSIRVGHLRVIEAYYDGSNVVVQFSEPIPLTLMDSAEKQQKTVNSILRWLVATPVGRTSEFSSLKIEY